MKRLLLAYHNQNGMSLIEVLIAMGLLSLVISGAFTLMRLGYKSWDLATARMDTRTEVSRTVSVVADNLREARELSENVGTLGTAAGNNIIMYTNVDTDTALEKVRYYLSDDDLRCAVYQATQTTPSYTFSGTAAEVVVSESLTNTTGNPLFKYYTSTGTEITALPASASDLKQIVRVDINVSSHTNGNAPQEAYAFQTSVYFRNLKR